MSNQAMYTAPVQLSPNKDVQKAIQTGATIDGV